MLGTPGFCLPDMLTFLPCTAAGLLFMREPQVAVGQTVGSDQYNVTLDLSVSRAQGKDTGTDFYNPGPRGNTSDNQLDKSGVGEASKQPCYKGRLTLRLFPDADIKMLIGGTGQFMRERHSLYINTAGTSPTTNPDNYTQVMVDSWFAQGFASFTFYFIRISGHYFQGDNIDQYFGGIDQGVTKYNEGFDYASIKEVRSQGGWGELFLDFRRFDVPLTFSFGYGTEVVDKDTLDETVTTARTSNSTTWGNFSWYLGPQFRFGVEVAHYVTKYMGLANGEDWRIQSTFQYFF
jgi:hypothetical protein